MKEFDEILQDLDNARINVGFEFMRKETVFECATQIYIKQLELNKEKENDKRREI